MAAVDVEHRFGATRRQRRASLALGLPLAGLVLPSLRSALALALLVFSLCLLGFVSFQLRQQRVELAPDRLDVFNALSAGGGERLRWHRIRSIEVSEARFARVVLVTHDVGRVRLPFPRDVLFQHDPDFDEKAELLRRYWTGHATMCTDRTRPDIEGQGWRSLARRLPAMRTPA